MLSTIWIQDMDLSFYYLVVVPYTHDISFTRIVCLPLSEARSVSSKEAKSVFSNLFP